MIAELTDITGKTALITGGSQGIGKALSLALAERGADVVINYRSGHDKALQTKAEIESMGRRCYLHACDLSRVEAAGEIADFVRSEGLSVDILVLCASVQVRKEWNEITPEEFEMQMNTNFRSSLQLIQRFYPGMEERKWGRILTIGSVQQIRPQGQMVVYSAAKSAQVNMVRTLAIQFAPHGVTINNLAPGAITTGRNEAVLRDADYKRATEAKIPVGFIGEPEDCAPMAVVLCSDAGRYITGQDIFVDGGMGLPG